MSLKPELPPAYEPVFWEGETSVLREGARRARAGAPEGTLVWSTLPDRGEGRLGQHWEAPGEALFTGLILRPEEPFPVAVRSALVALVAAGVAVAEQVPPMTDLRYGWPNDLLLNQGKAASVTLRGETGPEGGEPWLVLGLNLNVAGEPRPGVLDSASPEAGGHGGAGARGLLEGFARHFLAWINRWDTKGFEPVLRAFAQRAPAPGTSLRVSLPGASESGRLREWTPEGGMLLELPTGTLRTISLAEAFGTEEAQGAQR